jgi:hypothetical protein
MSDSDLAGLAAREAQPPAKQQLTNGDGWASRKLIFALSVVAFGLVVASVFAFLVGHWDIVAGKHVWSGKLSTDKWVGLFEFCCYTVMAYIGGNLAHGGIETLKAIFGKMK